MQQNITANLKHRNNLRCFCPIATCFFARQDQEKTNAAIQQEAAQVKSLVRCQCTNFPASRTDHKPGFFFTASAPITPVNLKNSHEYLHF
jgi:hypothetical protein